MKEASKRLKKHEKKNGKSVKQAGIDKTKQEIREKSPKKSNNKQEK